MWPRSTVYAPHSIDLIVTASLLSPILILSGCFSSLPSLFILLFSSPALCVDLFRVAAHVQERQNELVSPERTGHKHREAGREGREGREEEGKGGGMEDRGGSPAADPAVD